LTRRDLQPEIMDDPALDPERHDEALRGLARVNVLSASDAITWRPIAALAKREGLRELSVLDLASGGGDVGLALVRRAARAGVTLRLTGYDMSSVAVDRARAAAAAAGIAAEFVVRDVLSNPPDRPFDVVTCSLFLHHLETPTAVDVLRLMREAATRLVVVNDLVRSRLGYVAAQIVCRVVTRSAVVRYDGPQSVAAAFTLDEVRRAAAEADLRGADVRQVWPFRFRLAWERS
jgi:2-polyprenyl-3-methyl-5-hydroxy-6-metoxy-1,4-benzoquinol methylase